MIVELASLPPMVQAYIQKGEQISIVDNGREIATIANSCVKDGLREPNLLTTLTGKTIEVDDSIWFEPMSDEELGWWNGDYTDKYGLSK